VKRAEELKRKRAEQAAKELEASKNLADKLGKTECVIPMKVGEEGKAFGAVTAQDIVLALKAKGIDVDRRAVQLDQPIKHLGEFEVKIKLHADVIVPVKVSVTKA
jgi:large subunit ribosomal protein L9